MWSDFKNGNFAQWCIKHIGFRVPLLILCILALFNFDFDTLNIVGFSIAFLFCQALASHLLRKILFPYLDMELFFRKAKEDPMASAITILAVCLVLSALIISASSLWVGAR